MISSCNEVKTDKIISVSENRRTFRVNNSSSLSINKVEVDGCYISSGLKCDYLFEIIDKEIKQIFYVELKGKNIEHGIKQLEATIKYCLSVHKNIPKECYIVASRVPKSSTSSQKLKKEFKRKNNIQLFIDTKTKEIIV
ncbi:hypothetical protein GSY74_10000 [Sulfurovum sp. bin170]|uniref:hypothetical protein n=1 Tax=Sulfurovum sp. bin170 TaxID=2695268 RepID=UPI0013DF0360|nr:hypothetical protein [Sulfurovum sp. bin170]NEW61616.1 hypothetical protein [Sulfurovum sp. bin170]